MLKSQIPIFGEGGRVGDWWPTFDAESKNAKIPNSYFQGGGVGGNQFPKANFKFSKSSSELKFLLYEVYANHKYNK